LFLATPHALYALYLCFSVYVLSLQAQLAMGAMGLPVVLAVLQEDRDDLELLKGALEVLQLTVALPEAASAAGSRGGAAAAQQQLLQQQQQQQLEVRSP
jgi:hypothetical protein